MNLNDVYGRAVPKKVQLTAGFDCEQHCVSKVGDIVSIVAPPESVKVDSGSIYAALEYQEYSETVVKPIRLFEHEYRVIGE